MSESLPRVHRALLRLHRRLLRLLPGRFPEPWADDAHGTACDLVSRAFVERGRLAALLAALGECADLLRLGISRGDWLAAPARFARDLRFGLRRLRSRPVRTFSVVVMLAIGVGSSTAIFSIVNNTLLRPMMLRDIDTLVRIDDVAEDGSRGSNVSPLNAATVIARSATLDAVIVQDYRPFVLRGSDEAQRVRGAGVSRSFFEGLGIRPDAGRTFTPDEYAAGEGAQAVLISHDLWQRSFGADPDVLGTTVVLNGDPRTVIGVMPPGFHFPYEADVWVPIEYEPTAADTHYLLVFGRMGEGRSIADVQRELDVISADLRTVAPEANRGIGLRAMPLRENLVRGYDRTALALLAVVGFLLLIGAVNVASLGLADAQSRAREMAIRAALGASHRRQVAQLLAESTSLALLGGAAGVGLAVLLQPLLGLLVPPVMTIELAQDDIAFDHRVLAFALAASVLAALVAGVLPALRSAVRDPARTLRAGGAVGRQGRITNGQIVAGIELCLAMVLLTGASAITAAFVREQSRPLGYDPSNVLTLRASLPESRYPDERDRIDIADRLRERLVTLPGVAAAGIATGNPALEGWIHYAMAPERPDDPIYVNVRFVTAGAFESLGIPLLAGRPFDVRDRAGPAAVMVSRETARLLWGDERSATGRMLRVPDGPMTDSEWMVVGVAGDVREASPARATIYLPYARHEGRYPAQELTIFLRGQSGDPVALAPAARRAVRELDPDLALFDVQPQTQVRGAELALERAGAALAAGLVLFGLLLSGVGVFGVVSHSAARSTRALGIRKALGAGAVRLAGAALLPTLRTVLLGLALGAGVAWSINRAVASRIWGIPVPDATLYIGCATALGIVALAAACGPLVRAVRVDAARVLRAD